MSANPNGKSDVNDHTTDGIIPIKQLCRVEQISGTLSRLSTKLVQLSSRICRLFDIVEYI